MSVSACIIPRLYKTQHGHKTYSGMGHPFTYESKVSDEYGSWVIKVGVLSGLTKG